MNLLKDEFFFRHVNNVFTDNFDFFIAWFWLVFGATRIQINVFWNGSGSDQMKRIHADPDPQHCFLVLYFFTLNIHTPPPRANPVFESYYK